MRARGRRSTVLGGAMTALAARGLFAVSQLLYLAAMARLLQPSDFGILAIATSVTALATMLTDFGFSTSVLQTQRLSSHAASALFWANLALACVLALVLVALRGPIALAFGEDALRSAVLVLALTLPFTSVAALYKAILSRWRLWGVVYPGFLACQIAAQVAGVLFAVVVRADHVALLVMPVVTALASTALFVAVTRWAPRRRPRLAGLAGVLRQGSALSSTAIANYLNRQSDNLLIGFTYSAGALGFYTRGYSLFSIPSTYLVSPLSPVVLSGLRRHRDDAAAWTAALGRVAAPLLLATALLTSVVCGFAAPIVDIVYGAGWAPVVPILSILGLSIYPVSGGQVLNWALISQGRARTLLVFALTSSVLRFLAFVVAVQHSVLAVAAAWTATSWLFTSALAVVAHRAGALPLHGFRSICLPSALALAAALAANVAFAGRSSVGDWPGSAGAGLAELSVILAAGLAAGLLDQRIRGTAAEIVRRVRPGHRVREAVK